MVVFLWWCSCGAVFVVVFLWWCSCCFLFGKRFLCGMSTEKVEDFFCGVLLASVDGPFS